MSRQEQEIGKLPDKELLMNSTLSAWKIRETTFPESVMKFYRYNADPDNFGCLELIENRRELSDLFNEGKKLSRTWMPVPARAWTEAGGLGDFPAMPGNIPVFSRRAVGVLNVLVRDCAEFLPLAAEGEGYFAVNVHAQIDALNAEGSIIIRLPDGAISHIRRFSLNQNLLQGLHMFQLPETKFLETYVSQQFVEAVKEHELRGLNPKALSVTQA